MKIRNSSRVLAIVLALMMIVPMISIPTFAEETPLYKQDFETGTLADLIETKNPTVSIKDLGDDDAHGNVFYFDMNKGPYDDGYLYLIKDRNSARYKVTSYTKNDDGTINGKMTITLSGVSTDVMFENAVLETQKLTTDENGALANAVQLYTIKLQDKVDENGDYVYDEDWNIVQEEVKDAEWNDVLGFALVDCKTANAIQSGGNIAVHSYLKSPALQATGSVVTYSMDYYVNHDWNIATELHAMRGTYRFVSFGRDGNNLVIKPHGDLTLNEGSTIQVATDNWFNLTIVADYAAATTEVYVNGKFAFSTLADSKAAQITAKVVEGNAVIDANSLQLIQVNRNAGETRFYDGDLMVDNIAIYSGKVVPEATSIPTYMFSSNFNGSTLPYNFGGGNDVISFTEDSNAVKIDLDTYDEETGLDNYTVKAIDQNFRFTTLPRFEPIDGASTYFFEADYYIPTGAEYKIQSQFRLIKSEQKPSGQAWPSLYQIYARGTTAEFVPCGELSDSASGMIRLNNMEHISLPVDAWFTITTKIDLVTGLIQYYIDGVWYAEWYLFWGGTKHTNVIVEPYGTGNGGWIVAKPNKINGNATTENPDYSGKYTGHGGSYPNGYSEYLMLDNLEVYTDPSMLTVKEYVEVDHTLWTEDYSNKLVNSHAWNLGGRNPISATYTDELNSNMAIRFDLVAPESALKAFTYTDDAIVRGTSVFYVGNIQNVEGFDPTAPLEDVIANLTRVWDTSFAQYEIDSKGSYYMVRDGAVAYLYGIDGKSVTGAEPDTTQLAYIGSMPIYSKDDASVPAMLEASLGGANTDALFKIGEGTYYYNAEGNNTYVFSADYYVPADAKGRVESQIFAYNTYYDLYRFNFTKGIEENSGAALLKDAWNKINMVLTITAAGAYTFDIYLNGVYNHTVSFNLTVTELVDEDGDGTAEEVIKPAAIPSGAWSVAKIMKWDGVSNAGNFYVDNTSVQTLEAAMLQTKDVPFGTATAVVDGVTVALDGFGGETKFYANTVELGKVDIVAAFANAIATEKAASIRTNAPTGLRFASEVDVDVIAALKAAGYTVSIGTLIAPRDIVKGQALTHALEGLKVDVKNFDGKYYNFDNDDSTTHVVGSIVDIKEGNLDRDFTARGYIKVEKDGNVEYIYSATTHSVSVADQAAATIAAGAITEADDGYAVVAGFAAKAN